VNKWRKKTKTTGERKKRDQAEKGCGRHTQRGGSTISLELFLKKPMGRASSSYLARRNENGGFGS